MLGLSGAISAHWDLAARSGLFASREFLRACAVRNVAMPAGDAGDTVGTWPDALARAYAVPRVLGLPDEAGVIAALREPAWTADSTAFVVGPAARDFRLRGVTWSATSRHALRLRAPPAYTIADFRTPGWMHASTAAGPTSRRTCCSVASSCLQGCTG